MSIVNDMPSLTTPISGDELPIERGTALYKIDYTNLASTVLSGASNAASLYLTGTTWSALYTQLTALNTNRAAAYKCDATVTSLLTGTKVSAIVFGVVSRLTSTIFEFMAGGPNSAAFYKWRVTFDSNGSSATVGSVYRVIGAEL